MKIETDVQDVLNEIEFELAQGTVSRDDLGKAVQQVRQFHGKLRAEIYGTPAQSLDVREIVNRQFQLNDMLLTLVQEMSAALHDTQARIARTRALAPSSETTTAQAIDTVAMPDSDDSPPWDDDAVRALNTATNDTLVQKMDARPVGVPIVGGVLSRVRAALHDVILFYVNRLARRQATINGVYGEQLLVLKRKCEVQEEQIRKLTQALKR